MIDLKENIFRIEKNKTIPINKNDISFSTKENIIFDEEITLLDENVKNIYAENRVRLIQI